MKIFRPSDPGPIELADVSIDDTTIFTKQLMGEHVVDANWISLAPLDIRIGDYITVGAEKLYLNRPPDYLKANNFTHKYAARFEGEVYELYRIILQDERKKRFPYFGDPEEYLLLILENMNAHSPGWTLNIELPGVYEPLPLEFDGDSCRVAMTKVMEAFGLEFRLVQKEIIVRQDVGFESIYSFEYGQWNGMYQLIRESRDDSQVVTRLYGYGGDKNLPASYRGGLNELTFDVLGNNYIEANVDIYGIREGVVTFPEIFPRRTGGITEVMANNVVRDSTLDFDLNNHLIGGVTAKIVFKSGALSGYEFEIEKGGYDHVNKEITFIPTDEANGAVIPDTGSFQPAIGDLYTLIGINMPETYVTAAEAELLAATQAHHVPIKSPQAVYSLPMDEKYVRENGIELDCGMRVGIMDAPIGLDDRLRIFAIAYPLVNPARIMPQIADSIPYKADERIKKDVAKVKSQTQVIDRTRAENFRESMWRFRQLQEKIYDPDDYFDTENIRPQSIETLMLSVGAKSQNFVLNEVEIAPNYLGNPNSILISSGDLIHFEIEILGLGYVWEMDINLIEGLVPETYYYIYARCNRSALTGTWVISETPLATESEAGFYHFWLGILYPVKNGIRFFQFTKGMTYIVGDTITTGKIQSADGKVSFGLTDSNLNIGLEADKGMDFNISSPGNLTIRGAILVNAIFADTGVIQNLRVKQLRTADTGKRMEIRAFDDPEETIPVHNQKFYDDDGNLALTIDTEIDDEYVSPALVSAGIKLEKTGTNRKVVMSQNGFMSDGSFMSYPDGLGQIAGSILGVLRSSAPSAFGQSAGVVGWDGDGDPQVPTYGGLFNTLMAYAMHVGVTRVTAGNYTMLGQDLFVSCYNASANEVSLPAAPKKGRIAIVRRGNGPVNILGNGQSIHVQGVGIVSIKGLGASNGQGDCAFMIYDGTYWTFNRIRV